MLQYTGPLTAQSLYACVLLCGVTRVKGSCSEGVVSVECHRVYPVGVALKSAAQDTLREREGGKEEEEREGEERKEREKGRREREGRE